jgi:hypothetical protein
MATGRLTITNLNSAAGITLSITPVSASAEERTRSA